MALYSRVSMGLPPAYSQFAVNVRPSLSCCYASFFQVDLCVQLNVPILGPSPGTFTALSRKSGGRAILADAGEHA